MTKENTLNDVTLFGIVLFTPFRDVRDSCVNSSNPQSKVLDYSKSFANVHIVNSAKEY